MAANEPTQIIAFPETEIPLVDAFLRGLPSAGALRGNAPAIVGACELSRPPDHMPRYPVALAIHRNAAAPCSRHTPISHPLPLGFGAQLRRPHRANPAGGFVEGSPGCD